MMVTASFRLVEGFSEIPYKEFFMVYSVYSYKNNKFICLESKKLTIDVKPEVSGFASKKY